MKHRIASLLSNGAYRTFTVSALLFILLFTAIPAYAEEAQAEPHISILVPLLALFLFAMLAGFIHQTWFRQERLTTEPSSEKPKLFILITVLVIGSLIRLYLAATNEGYVNDLSLFHYWGNYAFNEGILNLYHGDFFLDYPPAYMYVLYVLAAIQKLLGIPYGGTGFLVLYKLPAIIADVIAAIYIYKQASKKLSHAWSLGLMLLYWLNPVVLLDGAVWGQVDSIFTLLIVVSIGLFIDNKISKASLLFAIAALFKPQAFIFMPVVLLALLYQKRWKMVAVSAGWGFCSFLLLSLPLFQKGEGIVQLVKLYGNTLSSYAYVTVNSFNVYMLFDLNWASLEDHSILGYLGWIAVVLAVVYAAYIGIAGKVKGETLYFVAASLIVIVFMFVTKMHERYMFSVVMLLIMAFVQSKDKRLLYLSYGFTATNLFNLYVVLAYSKQTTFVPYDGVTFICSLINVLLTLVLLFVGYDIYVRGNVRQPVQLSKEQQLTGAVTQLNDLVLNPEFNRKWYSIGMERKDWIIVAVISLIYGIVTLVNLGSTDAPKTVWQPSTTEDYIVFDLGESKQLQRVISFGGVGSGEYSYSFSNDGVNWIDEQLIEHDHVAVFSWKETTIDLNARYMRLQATKTGFSIHEIGLFQQGSETTLPVQVSQYNAPQGAIRGEAAHLIDEQTIVPFHHTYMVGSYFDEIYHARTAYEHLEGIKAYESTHPPLGKLLIAIGIQLFGLSPFGWRIVGALFGVLMLPTIYWMTKAILRKTTYAAGAMILFAVDFMHFAQTRISTIDVYGVFFIMLMFFFMNQYSRMNFYRDRLWQTFIPLGLAGLFFGLGVASKWIVLYGGAGLAIMLAITLLRRYWEYRHAGILINESTQFQGTSKRSKKNKSVARSSDNKEPETVEVEDQKLTVSARVKEHAVTIRKSFIPYTMWTLAICVLFYIVIPAGIYALANIPVLNAQPGGYTFKALVDYQVNMYNYHSNLVSSHPFSSTWWEWPFMKRPVWYYLDSAPLEGMRSTIASFGNPLIWWTGLFTMLATAVISIRRKDGMATMLVIAYFSQYVPWMLVPRETFLYHYFAMVPFMIISIMYIFKLLEEHYQWSNKIRYVFIGVATALFIMFYPALSGMMVSEGYITNVLRWFPSWLF